MIVVASATSCLAQTDGTSSSPGSADDIVELPVFSVSSEMANSYRATDSMSASRIRSALIDTPASVNVITGDFLKDISAASLFDATQYVSGIGNGRLAGGSGILDRQTIRGYENDGRTIDNFNSGFQANLDPMLYERVEIVKGPNAILAPTGTPGGSINVITKSPQFESKNVATLEIGRFFGNKLSVDSTGALLSSERFAYRVIAGYQDADSFVDGSIRNWSVNPQLTFKISDRSKITIKGNYVDWGTHGAASNPSITLHAGPEVANGATVPVDSAPGFVYGEVNGSSADWAVREDQLIRGSVEYTTQLGDHMSLRLGAMRHYDEFYTDFTGLATPGQSTQSRRYNPYTGVYTPEHTWALNATTGNYEPTFSAQYDPSSIPRSAGKEYAWNHDTQIQADLAGRYELGAATLQPIVGATWQQATTDFKAASAAAGQLPNLNLSNPDNSPTHPAIYNVTTKRYTETTKKQVYVHARLGFLEDRLLISGGVSRLWIDAPVTNKLNNTKTRLEGATNTPLGGVLFKFSKGVSGYYSYSTNANAVSFGGEALFQEGKQHEVGLKTEFFDRRLSVSMAYFDIAQTNIVTPNPSYFLDPANNPQFFKADLANQGFEVDVVGGITKNLTILASFTDMELRDTFDRRMRNIPDRTANAMLKYDFREGAVKGASVYFGVTHVGDQAGENPAASLTPLGVVTQVSFYAPARTICNLGGSYSVGRFLFNLNVDNLLDKETIWQPSGRFSLSPYPSTNVRFTTTVEF